MTDLSTERPFNRCSRIKRNGEQCKRPPIRGGTVCASHGGRAPQVRAKAQTRLLMSADKLMAALLKIALNEKIPLQHRLVAIRDGLDRAGFGARQAVDLDVQVSGKLSVYEQIVLDSTLPLGEYDDLDGPPALPDPNVIDAEIVEDDPAAERARVAEMDEAERNERRREQFLQKQRSEPPAPRSTPTPPAPSIEDDPRDRAPVRSRDAAVTKGREQFLLEREGLRKKSRHQRRA